MQTGVLWNGIIMTIADSFFVFRSISAPECSAVMLDVTTIILFLTVFTLACWALGSHPANLPPGPTRWPLIGYIPKKKMSDTVAWIRDMRSTYGDMWTVWRGNHPMVFIAGPKLMREALVDKADFLSERPGWMHANKLMNKGRGKREIYVNLNLSHIFWY